MGNASSTACRACPDCDKEENCLCPKGLSKSCSSAYSSSQCTTDAIKEAHDVKINTETNTFIVNRDSRRETIKTLTASIGALQTERDANGTRIQKLKDDLNTTTTDYASGLDQCMSVSLVEAKQRSEACEKYNDTTVLPNRNVCVRS